MKRLAVLLIAALIIFFAPAGADDCVQVDYDHCFYGCPKGIPEDNILIKRRIYTMSVNPQTKFADWVAYKLTPKMLQGDAKLTRKWKADPCLKDEETLEPSDYRGAHEALGVDRGHQAPLASFKGTNSWHQTNYLSNITPQKSELNQGPWRMLEKCVRDLVRQGVTVHVISGPLYKRHMPSLPNADEAHRVPSGYWKIIFHEFCKCKSIYSSALMFEQSTLRKDTLEAHLSTVDEIEDCTGLDFLHELDGTK